MSSEKNAVDLLGALERLKRSTWDSRAMPSRSDITVLIDAYAASLALADKAITCVEDAVRETSWGTPTFGPDIGEQLRETWTATGLAPAMLAARSENNGE